MNEKITREIKTLRVFAEGMLNDLYKRIWPNPRKVKSKFEPELLTKDSWLYDKAILKVMEEPLIANLFLSQYPVYVSVHRPSSMEFMEKYTTHFLWASLRNGDDYCFFGGAPAYFFEILLQTEGKEYKMYVDFIYETFGAKEQSIFVKFNMPNDIEHASTDFELLNLWMFDMHEELWYRDLSGEPVFIAKFLEEPIPEFV